VRDRLTAKLKDLKASEHTGLSGGRGDLRRGTRTRGERVEIVRGECAI
jgi:hypothetical protein